MLIGMVMFSLGSSKETFADEGTGLQDREASDLLGLLRAQERMLERAMSQKDMSVYETHAQQIAELLEHLTNVPHGPNWPG